MQFAQFWKHITASNLFIILGTLDSKRTPSWAPRATMRSTSMSFESMRLFPYVVFFFYFLFSNLPLPVLCCSFYYSLHLLGRRLRSPLAYFQTAVFHKPQTTPYTTTDSHFIIPCCQPCILHLSFSLFVSLPLSLSLSETGQGCLRNCVEVHW